MFAGRQIQAPISVWSSWKRGSALPAPVCPGDLVMLHKRPEPFRTPKEHPTSNFPTQTWLGRSLNSFFCPRFTSHPPGGLKANLLRLHIPPYYPEQQGILLIPSMFRDHNKLLEARKKVSREMKCSWRLIFLRTGQKSELAELCGDQILSLHRRAPLGVLRALATRSVNIREEE